LASVRRHVAAPCPSTTWEGYLTCAANVAGERAMWA
jgi:hypothetical protein